MIKKNTYSKKQAKELNFKNIKLTTIQELISESSILLKKGFVNHIDPNLLIQSLRQFIKLVRKIKYPSKRNKEKFEISYRLKPILLYSENKYTRQLLNLALQKFNGLSGPKIESLIEVGGVKQLIACTNSEKRCGLVIFIEKPTQTNIDFCLTNRIYMLSMFLTNSLDSLKGGYKVPVAITSLKRYFWLIALLELI
ncbi:MAG TPA: hypothetical protein PLC61_04370 [Chitinophagales bacterium]|nr:hypothetical protein [Chitinophagales bacterium]